MLEKSLSQMKLGERTVFGNLTMFSLEGNLGSALEYLTLEDAMRRGVARVSEISDGGSVPELKFTNDAELPVLILDGEELLGAKQNRTVNLTILAPARATTIIPVSCVEAGRWRHQSRHFALSDRYHFARGRAVRVAAVSRSMRRDGRAVADQGQVWADITAKAARMEAPSATQAMGDIFDHHRPSVERYVDALVPADGQSGALFAIGSEIVGLDLFDRPATLAAVLAKLVRSYALDALEVDRGSGTSVAKGTAEDFLERLAGADVSTFEAIGLGTDLRISGDRLVGGGLAFEGGLVHLAAFAVEPEVAGAGHHSGRMASPRVRRAARARC